ncbi:selenoprotein K-like [Anneissia japonica]|uniref:selenoprotein K-like n=1 Tax=Anneissia japonica TaxID=1529436 RepID=UPI00142581C1|nr:selenoprotein K-like [Anneissia japonica]
MAYVDSSGNVIDSKSVWRLSIIPELFWGIINFIALFFQTMYSPGLTSKGTGYTSDYRVNSNGQGPPRPPPRGPRRRMGGFGGASAPRAPPPAGGG